MPPPAKPPVPAMAPQPAAPPASVAAPPPAAAAPPASGSQVATKAETNLPAPAAAPAQPTSSTPTWGQRVGQWGDQAKAQVSQWADQAQQAWDKAPAWKNTALMAAGVGGAGLVAGRMLSGDQRKSASEIVRPGAALPARPTARNLHPALHHAPIHTVPLELAPKGKSGHLGKGLAVAGAAGMLLLPAAALLRRRQEEQTPREVSPMQMNAEEGLKVSSAEQLEKSISKLQALEDNPPEPAQLKRYALVGGAISPLASALGDVIEGKDVIPRLESGKRDLTGGVRRLASKAVTGALTTGVIPIIRHQLDRRAQISDLKEQLAGLTPVKEATALIPGGTSPAQRLASSRRIGSPRMTNLEGPSIAEISRTMGPVMPGAKKAN